MIRISLLGSQIITFDELSDQFDLIDGRTGQLAAGQYEIPWADTRWKDKRSGVIWRAEVGTPFSQQLAISNYIKLQCFMIDNMDLKKRGNSKMEKEKDERLKDEKEKSGKESFNTTAELQRKLGEAYALYQRAVALKKKRGLTNQ